MMRRALIAGVATALVAAVCVPVIASAAKPKPIKGTVVILTANGGPGDDGAFAGYVKSRKASCLSNRKVRLYGENTLLDKGTTAKNGSWALHLTLGEYGSYSKFKVKMSASRLKSGRKCGHDTAAVTPSPV